ISPGSSPGTMTTGPETWNGGAHYTWEINQAGSGEGADPGWDLLTISGALTITATSANRFNLDLTSLTLADAAGPISGFNNSAEYTWRIVHATAGITGFDPAKFSLNTSSFASAIGNGLFVLETANSGNDLVLRFEQKPQITTQP